MIPDKAMQSSMDSLTNYDEGYERNMDSKGHSRIQEEEKGGEKMKELPLSRSWPGICSILLLFKQHRHAIVDVFL